jgi:hypothetical protein
MVTMSSNRLQSDTNSMPGSPSTKSSGGITFCPATNRPFGMGARNGAAKVISAIIQRNYSVFRNLAIALEYWERISVGDWGPHESHFDTFIKNLGDSLQVATELQFAIGGPAAKFPGMAPLRDQLGATFDLFPDWQSNFKYERELASSYRNYLTHQGKAATIQDSASGEIKVLSSEAYHRLTPNKEAFTWNHSHDAYINNPADWVERTAACKAVMDDTLAFLNLSYERFIQHLDPWLSRREYQTLWGWQDGIDSIATSSVPHILFQQCASSGSAKAPPRW